jgi:hypothetical protein
VNGFERFRSSILGVIIPQAERLLEDHESDFSEIYKTVLLGGNGRTTIDRKRSKKEDFISKIFKGFTEINDVLERLQNIELYVRRFPYAASSVTRLQYLKYHFENYLNEVYILRERLNSYLTSIKRLYRKDPRKHEIDELVKNIRKTISGSLGSVIEVRGAHIHEKRYDDDDFARLRTLELLIIGDSAFKPFYDKAYKEIRKKKTSLIERNNKETRKIIDVYMDKLYGIVFDKKGELLFPPGLGGRKNP